MTILHIHSIKKMLITLFLLFLVSLPVNSSAVVKKSTLNVCYVPGAKKYDKVQEYIVYDTLEDCLKSGGRKPRGTFT